MSTIYHALFILVPLIFFPKSSEVFEFTKMNTVYLGTIIISVLWIIKMIKQKKFIFRRTILDIPILIFLMSQTISTLISIDPRTSIFGYYSRFHGGLLSYLCYSVLYWAFVTNITKKQAINMLKTVVFTASFVSLWAILEKTGHSPSCIVIQGQFNVDCWVQDVQTRVFATLGQPNWLAAYLATVIPLNIYFIFKETSQKILYSLLLAINFMAFLFTGSRSGLIALTLSLLGFSIILFLKSKNNLKTSLSSLSLVAAIIAVLTLFIGTPFTPSLNKLISSTRPSPTAPVIENNLYEIQTQGGTDSGQIRKIVWQGAIDIWKAYPLFGSGVETFAYSYYQFRPAEHNLVSEWNYLYNKAHNEFLNFAATTGTVGLLTYSGLIATIGLVLFIKVIKSDDYLLPLSLLAGFVTIPVTNFFGFSVVIIGLLTFILPAIYLAPENTKEKKVVLETGQKIMIGIVLAIAGFLSINMAKYWTADLNYSMGKKYASVDDLATATRYLAKAIKLSPNEAFFHEELADTYGKAAVALAEQGNEADSIEIAKEADKEIEKAIDLSPRNVIIQKSRANVYIDLSSADPAYLGKSIKTIEDLKPYAPTDAKIFYIQGLNWARVGETQKAIEDLSEAIRLKSNYKDARQALAIMYQENDQKDKAIEEYKYILEKLDPNDQLTRDLLTELQGN